MNRFDCKLVINGHYRFFKRLPSRLLCDRLILSHCLQTFEKQFGIKQSQLHCFQPLHHNEIKYQGETSPILCVMGAHRPQPEVEFSNFLALQTGNLNHAKVPRYQ